MPKGYHHLTYEERCQIDALRKRGDSQSAIAKELGFHRATICRELARNTGLKGYRHQQAQSTAVERRIAASNSPKKMIGNIVSIVEEKLALQWSPEQIAGWLKHKEDGQHVSHETIYLHIWKDKKRGGSLYKHLRHKGKKYNKRGGSKAGRGCIPDRVDIEMRPAIVEEKKRVGDWELDTIIGKNHHGAIVSIVDRASKLTKLSKVSGKTSKEVTQAMVSCLTSYRDHVLTLTADNGKEFAGHKEVSAELDAAFYFARPYHSWERGLNEHTNGLVRQYFPKGLSFEEISEEDVQRVENLLNQRPRKILDFQTPIEVFNKLTRSL